MPEKVEIDADFLLKLGKDMGHTQECMENIQGDVSELKVHQKKLATKKDVNSKIEAGVKEHEQIHHPSKEEKLGRDLISGYEWLCKHWKGTGSGLTLTGALTWLAMKFMEGS